MIPPKKFTKIAGILILLFAVVMFLLPWFREFMAIDRCLDNGGCWDYRELQCRSQEANAQELCDRSR